MYIRKEQPVFCHSATSYLGSRSMAARHGKYSPLQRDRRPSLTNCNACTYCIAVLLCGCMSISFGVRLRLLIDCGLVCSTTVRLTRSTTLDKDLVSSHSGDRHHFGINFPVG